MKSKQLCVAVLVGGPSAEAEVSRVSGKGVADALKSSFAKVVTVELGPDLGDELRDQGADVVFPVLHGPPGEDGTVQGFLEILGLPYVGSGVLASACAMDKVVAKQVFRAHGIPVAREVICYRRDGLKRGVEQVLNELGPDVVIKPASQGSALGVVFGSSDDKVGEGLDRAFEYDSKVLVEERIMGKEITAAILEKDQPMALPVIEIATPAGAWYDYEHRYTPGLSDHIIPAPISEDQDRRVRELAVAAHVSLDCRDLCRVDFVLPEDGEPVVLEVNTIPGMTPTSLYPDAAKAAGITFEQLVAGLVESALARR
ncbi:D-alanine--D-alanine ligase [candidate division KSB1 bacterium]